VINGLTRWGANVVHKGNALVHVSGHAPAGELLYVLNMVRPRNFLPVHGEWRHMRAHADLAKLAGVPQDRIVIAEDGVVVDLYKNRAKIVGAVQAGYVYVDGASVGDVSEASLKDRRILGEEGFISVVVAVDSTTGKILGEPEIHTRGAGIGADAYDDVIDRLQSALDKAASDGVNDPHQLRQLIRRSAGRWVNETYRRRPMIIPVLVEV
jgi:ribonuclease J